MVDIALIMGEELYYGYILTGVKNCFLVRHLLDLKQALSTISKNKDISLVFLDKGLEPLLDPEELSLLLSSIQPVYFEISKKGGQAYFEQINTLIKQLGLRSYDS